MKRRRRDRGLRDGVRLFEAGSRRRQPSRPRLPPPVSAPSSGATGSVAGSVHATGTAVVVLEPKSARARLRRRTRSR